MRVTGRGGGVVSSEGGGIQPGSRGTAAAAGGLPHCCASDTRDTVLVHQPRLPHPSGARSVAVELHGLIVGLKSQLKAEHPQCDAGQIPFRQFLVSTAIGLQPSNIIFVHAGASLGTLRSWRDLSAPLHLCVPYMLSTSHLDDAFLEKTAARIRA